MNDGTKQRLVGAVVLAALALILWPVVMGPKRDQSFVIESDIPARPVFGPSEIKQPEPRVDVSPIGEYQQKLKQQSEQAQRGGAMEAKPVEPPAPVEQPAATKHTTVTKPALDEDGVPIGWIIQVASFGERENANKLKKRLQDNGYRAQVKVDGKYARVFVGPYIDHAMAQKDMNSIARNHQVKPKMVRFSPG